MCKERIFIDKISVFSFTSINSLLRYVNNHKGILVAVNAEKILHSTSETQRIINSNIGYCDGFGSVKALKKKGYKDAIKIPGCELWLELVKAFNKSKTFYLIGGKQEIIEETVLKLEKEFPEIKILGYRNGFLKDEAEKKILMEDITYKKPDIVFVAMGSPRQELLMEELFSKHPAIYQGLGGSFDVFTNRVKRAPKWWVKNNLEWAYRLIKEPTRIKRQIHLIKFLFLLYLNKI